jgi:hypothetical protein
MMAAVLRVGDRKEIVRDMRTPGFLRLAAGIVLAVLLVGLGVGIYQFGVAAGAAGTASPGTVAHVYGFHPWGFGFGLFGIVWFLLFVLLVVGLARFALGFGGRRGGPRGYGHGWSDPTWGDERGRRIAELHRRLHEEQDAAAPRPPTGNG